MSLTLNFYNIGLAEPLTCRQNKASVFESRQRVAYVCNSFETTTIDVDLFFRVVLYNDERLPADTTKRIVDISG